MTDQNFAAVSGRIISASPFRAVIRRTDQSLYGGPDNEENKSDEDNDSGDSDNGDEDQFDRDEGRTLGADMSEIANHAVPGPAISEGVMDEYMLGGGPP